MSKRSFNNPGWTPTAVADTTNFTDAGHMTLLGGSSTQRLVISEISMGGLASSSATCPMVVSRDSTVGATLTALSGAYDAALDPATAALAAAPQPFIASTTKPQRSSTLHLLSLPFNAFGGIFRWVPAPGEEISSLGNTASLGELSLSAYTGGSVGLMGSNIIYEPV